MNVRSEHTTVADMLYAQIQPGASSAAAVPAGLETALSAQIWMNALMEPTCAANTRTARTPWGHIAVSVRMAIQGMASPVQTSTSAPRT